MNVVMHQMARLTVVLVMLLGLTLVGPMAASAQNGGNSGAAEACQRGGFASLARAEDSRTPFASQGECVSFAARGGTIVPVQVGPLSIVFDQADEFEGDVTFSGSDLLPGSPVTIDVFSGDGEFLGTDFLGTADADGNFTRTIDFGCGIFTSVTLNAVAADGTPISTSAAPPC